MRFMTNIALDHSTDYVKVGKKISSGSKTVMNIVSQWINPERLAFYWIKWGAVQSVWE